MQTYIGIDLGTSVIKGIAVDEQGTILATDAKENPLLSRKSTWAEQSPEIWWSSVLEILHLLSTRIEAKTVRGIGLSGQMHGMVLYDENRLILRRAIVWLDKRSGKEVEIINRLIDSKDTYTITGNPVFTGFLLPSLLWVKNHEVKIYSKIRTVSSPKDYIAYRLTGNLRSEPTDALATAVFDYARGQWSDTILDRLELRKDIFPEIQATSVPYGGLTKKVAKITGIPEGVPVYGASDQSMAVMGSGLINEGDAMIALSTGGQFLVIGKRGLLDSKRRLHTLNHGLDKVGLYMAATLSAGLSMKWFKTAIAAQGEMPYTTFLEGVRDIGVGSNGLFFLPFLAGERTPYFNPDLKGAFIGLSINHCRLHLIRAIMEGVAYSMRDCLEVFEELNLPIKRIILSGGGAKDHVWRQIIATVLNRPMEIINVSDHSPFGAAIFARFAQEGFERLPEFYRNVIQPLDFIHPNEKDAKRYCELHKKYKEFANLMNKEFRQL